MIEKIMKLFDVLRLIETFEIFSYVQTNITAYIKLTCLLIMIVIISDIYLFRSESS